MTTEADTPKKVKYQPGGAPITVSFFMSALRGSWYLREVNGPTMREGITDDAAPDEVTLIPEKIAPAAEYKWRMIMFGPARKIRYAAGVEVKQGRRVLAKVEETGEIVRVAKSMMGFFVFEAEA